MNRLSPARFSRKPIALGASALAGALMLTACGGGDNASSAPIDPVVASIQALPAVKDVPFDLGTGAASCPATSRPFSTMLCSTGFNGVPIDLKNTYGYAEKEFFLSGKANVYNLGSDERAVVSSAGHAYTDRILVRYPMDPAKFTGRVYIDILNASSGVDLEDTWRRSWEHILKTGDAYIGITSKSLTANALKKFDPIRYKDINWQVDGKNEDGLFWDMLSQLGTQLRQPGTGGILGNLQPRWIYLSGQSQSGFYMNTYITAFTDRLEKAAPGGKPLFDGYINLVGPGSMPIRSESGVPSATVPKMLYKATSVPQIVLMSEAESRFYGGGGAGGFPVFPPYSRRADSNTAADKFRFYEVAGAPHADPTSPIIPINSEIAKAKADGTGRAPKVYVAGQEESALQLDEFVTGALENLHAWAANGTAAPAADANWMRYRITTDAKGNSVYDPLRDQFGNALGGLRSPLIEAPLYRFYGQAPTISGGIAGDYGAMSKLPDATINALFPAGRSDFQVRFDTAADALVTGRYIIASDAAKLKSWAIGKATTQWP